MRLKSLVLGEYWGLKGKGDDEMMKWCEASRLTGMSDMLLRYGSHKM